MASDLQRLAEGVRAVGDAAGPTRRELAEAARLARSLGQSVPRHGGQSGSAVVAALAEAERRCRAADEALARFDSKADAFAKRLAGGSGGFGGAVRSVVGGVKTVAVAGGTVVIVALSGGDVPPAIMSALPLDAGVKDAGVRLVEGVHTGFDTYAEALKTRDEMVGEPIAKPLYSDTRPPPPAAGPRLWKPKA
ncbi:MAG: hypothetical protein EOL89_00085 [Actinobacteria bacterium]|nr:hypothetical protein [Actinomycetota bacterium]